MVVIDTHEQRLCYGKVKSPFYCTYSLEVCHGAGQKVYLSLGGCMTKYTSTVSDFLDVTEMYNYKKEFSVFNEKKMQSLKEEVEKSRKSIDKNSQ